MRTKGKWYGIMTFAIVVLIGMAFLLTNIPEVIQVISRSSSMPLYRSNQKSVCLITICENDETTLRSIALKASKAGVPLTIAISTDRPALSQDMVSYIHSLGHCLALYGLKRDTQETSEHWMQRSRQVLQDFKTTSSTTNVLYMPYLGQHTKDAARFCSQNDLQYLLYCKDSRAFEAKTQQAFAEVLSQNAQAGDFIYLGVDETTNFEAIFKCFEQKGLPLDTVGNILFD